MWTKVFCTINKAKKGHLPPLYIYKACLTNLLQANFKVSISSLVMRIKLNKCIKNFYKKFHCKSRFNKCNNGRAKNGHLI